MRGWRSSLTNQQESPQFCNVASNLPAPIRVQVRVKGLSLTHFPCPIHYVSSEIPGPHNGRGISFQN